MKKLPSKVFALALVFGMPAFAVADEGSAAPPPAEKTKPAPEDKKLERRPKLEAKCEEKGLTPEECKAKLKERREARCEEKGLTPEECKAKLKERREERRDSKRK